MHTAPLTDEMIRNSVMAVPPLARRADYSLDREENVKIIRHIEGGGVNLLLYGGNANFYHVPLGEYETLLGFLAEAAAAGTAVIPSVGPAFGMMMEQAKIARQFKFPTLMVLPQQGITTPGGVASGVRKFVEALGKPAVLYIKHDGYIDPRNVRELVDDGLISAIKYATVRPTPEATAKDEYLRELVTLVDPRKIISGIGEQPAIIHLRDFGLGGFTSGCVCVAPRLSMAMLAAIRGGDYEEAERIRETFRGLEDLRNAINPIRVLHAAVELAGIAKTGPLLPLLSNVSKSDEPAIAAAAKALLANDREPATR